MVEVANVPSVVSSPLIHSYYIINLYSQLFSFLLFLFYQTFISPPVLKVLFSLVFLRTTSPLEFVFFQQKESYFRTNNLLSTNYTIIINTKRINKLPCNFYSFPYNDTEYLKSDAKHREVR